MQMTGLADLEKQLLALADVATSKKILSRALRASMKPVLLTARAMCKKQSGAPDTELAASIRIAVKFPATSDEVIVGGVVTNGTGKIPGEAVVEDGITIEGEGSRKVRQGWRWSFREFGTKPHKIGSSSQALFQKGRMHAAIVAMTGKGIRRKESQALKREIVGSKAYQAQRTEHGHPGEAPRPFLRPAMDQHASSIPERFAEIMRKGIIRAVETKAAEQ